MIRLFVLVEGQTEEQFVKAVLLPHLASLDVLAVPIIVTTRRDRRTGRKIGRGGGHWKHWRKDLRRLAADHPGNEVRFTTLPRPRSASVSIYPTIRRPSMAHWRSREPG